MTAFSASILPESFGTKGAGFSKSFDDVSPTIVCRETTPDAYKTGKNYQHGANARDRRAARDKQARRQQQQDHFTDATAFAYFSGWALEMRITITWAACIYGDQNEGHILGLSDAARNVRLRGELARLLRNAGHAFACIWARDEGLKLGLHTHLGLYWPMSEIELVQLLGRLTGSPPSLARLPRDVVAQSECGGWQIKRNMARDRLSSAMRWTTYLQEQGKRHLVMPQITGKVLGVSRAISPNVIAPHKQALEAWKFDVGWEDS